jgi:uncharacterized protein YkwD
MSSNRPLRRVLLLAGLVSALPLACRTHNPAYGSGLARVSPSESTSRFEKEMFSRLNSDRAEHGLPALKWDPRLADIARYHSNDMMQNDFFGHTSPNTGTLDNRLVRAAYLAEVGRENVAIAPDVQVGQDNFLKSPGHRANILSNDVTHVGIGIVPGSSKEPNSLTITQVFGKPLQAETLQEAKAKIEKRIHEERRRSGRGPIEPNGKLSALAQKHIKNLDGDVAGSDLRRVGTAVSRDYKKRGSRKAEAIVTMAQNIYSGDDLQVSGELTSKSASSYGLAVSRVTDQEGRPSLVVLLLVLLNAH